MAAKRNIEIYRGDDYAHVVTISTRVAGVLTPVDITGRTYTAQLKSQASSSDIIATFVCTVSDASEGEVTVTLAHAVTANIPVGCRYVWDFEQNAGGVINTILRGEVTVKMDVTR